MNTIWLAKLLIMPKRNKKSLSRIFFAVSATSPETNNLPGIAIIPVAAVIALIK